MKDLLVFQFLLCTLFFGCNSTTEKKDTHHGSKEANKGAGVTSEKEDDEEAEVDLSELFSDMTELLQTGAGVNAELAVQVNIAELPQQDVDTLFAVVDKYPVLVDEGGFVFYDETLEVNLIKLQKTLEKMEPKALEHLSFLEKNPDGSFKNVQRNRFEDTFIDFNLNDYSFYSTAKNKKLYKQLEQATPEEASKLLATHYGITEEEVSYLKEIPAVGKFNSEKQAVRYKDGDMGPMIENVLTEKQRSPAFKRIVDVEKARLKRNSSTFLKKSSKAREEFYALNPGWYGEQQESGNTYIDSRNNYIYLPLGEISFADKVISHTLGEPQGSNSQGAIGEPDMSTERFDKADPKICNLGIRGVLTLEFNDNAIANVNGPDLYVFEMGAIEPTNLEISKDGVNWINVGKIDGGTALVDIEPFIEKGATYTYIRLTDLESPSALPGADVDAVAAIGGAIRLNLDSAVLFDTGKFQLKESASQELQNLVEAIKKIPKGSIIIEGHTDNVGDPKSNKKLSENRANEVAAFLKKNLSTSAYNLQTKGFGENQPIAPNDTDENKQKNRRVEILVIPK